MMIDSFKFHFRRYIICWGNLIENYWWGGGGAPRTAASFYFTKLCSSLYREVRFFRGLLYRDSTVCNFALLKGKRERVKEKGKADFH